MDNGTVGETVLGTTTEFFGSSSSSFSSSISSTLSPLTSEALQIQELFGNTLTNPHASTASWLLEDSLHVHNVLSTGYRNLDRLLGGGINTNEIIELYGLSGHGKTQICISTAVTTIIQSFRTLTSSATASTVSSTTTVPSPVLYFSTKTQGHDIAVRMHQLIFGTLKDEITRYGIERPEKRDTLITLMGRLYPHGMDYLRKQYKDTILSSTTETNPPSTVVHYSTTESSSNNSNHHNQPDKSDPEWIDYVLEHYLDGLTYESKYLLRNIRICTVLEPNDLLEKLQSTIQFCRDSGRNSRNQQHTSSTIPNLIIIDSIYGLISPVMGGPRNFLGHGYMIEISHRLRWLASTYHCAVLVTNNAILERLANTNEDTVVSKYANKYSSSSLNKRNRAPETTENSATGTNDHDATPTSSSSSMVTDIQTLRYSRVPYYRSALGPSWNRVPDSSLFIFREYGGNEEEWEYDIVPEQERIIAIHRSNRLVTFPFYTTKPPFGPPPITIVRIGNVIENYPPLKKKDQE